MPFYAYFKSSDHWDHHRIMLVAPSLEVMDEWWRLVSNSGKYSSVKRITPEWYVYSRNAMEVHKTLFKNEPAESLANKIIPQLVHDWGGRLWNMIPYQQLATDHRSGNVFFIRSRADHRLFWYYSERDNNIQLYEGRGTPFKVRISPSANNDGTVMIGSDPITISVLTTGNEENGHTISAGENGVLHVGNKAESFTFADFQGSFLAPSAIDKRISKVAVGQGFELVQ